MESIFDHHQTIAIDCDEVLTELIEYGIHNTTGKFANMVDSIDQITHYYFVNIFDYIEHGDVVDFFREAMMQDNHSLSIPTVDGAFEVLSKLKKQGKDLHVVTARPRLVADYTRRYIQKHFPDIFTDIHFAEHLTEYHRDKSEVCKEIGATLLVDDSMDYVLDCAQNGIETILLQRPWNKNRTETHTNIHRATGWQDFFSKE